MALWPGRASATNVAFLWHNVIGAVAVVIVGLAVSAVTKPGPKTGTVTCGWTVASMMRVFVTGGTFDKTYDEIRGRLSLRRHARAGDAASWAAREWT